MGFLTVLKQDDSGGLQVKSAADESSWLDVPPVPNTFVVNLGDCLERCTGGLLRATQHRVTKRLGAGVGLSSPRRFFALVLRLGRLPAGMLRFGDAARSDVHGRVGM